MDSTLFFKDKEEWRSWLAKNHDGEKDVWLVFYRKGFGDGISLEEAVEEAMCFGWIDGKLRRIDDERFVLRFSPRKANSVWSKINRERAEKLIESGRMTDTGLAKIKEAKETGFWDSAYTSKAKLSIPSDLKKTLMEDTEAWENFQHLQKHVHPLDKQCKDNRNTQKKNPKNHTTSKTKQKNHHSLMSSVYY